MSTALLDLKPSQIRPHPRNPRTDIGDVTELAASISALGVLEPLLVAPTGTEGKYWLLAGHRRLAGAKAAKAKTVPAIVREDLDTPEAQLEAMLVENLQRVDLTPVEEGAAYQALLEFPGYTVTRIAERTGRALATVRSRIKVAKLPEGARAQLHAGQISLADAEALTRFADDPAATERLLKSIGTDNWRWALQRETDDRTFTRAAAALRKKLEADGVTVVDEPANNGWRYGGPVAGQPCRIGYWTHELDPAEHATCPNRVVVIAKDRGPAGGVKAEPVECCTQLAEHPTKADRAVTDPAQTTPAAAGPAPAPVPDDETPEQRAEREAADAAEQARWEAKRQDQEDCETAAAIRRAHLRDLIHGYGDLTADMAAAVTAFTATRLIDVELYVEVHHLMTWLGLERDLAVNDDQACRDALALLKPGSALLAVVASSEEQSLDRVHCWTPSSLEAADYGASTRAWLDFIATHLGYEWTDWEAARLAAADLATDTPEDDDPDDDTARPVEVVDDVL